MEIPAASLPASNPPDLAERVKSVSPASIYEKAAWILMAAVLLLVLEVKLLPALFAGLLVHSLVHSIARRIAGSRISHHRAKVAAVGLIGLLVAGSAAGVVLLGIAFLRGRAGDLPGLLERMAAIVEAARERLGWERWIPAAEQLKDLLSRTLHNHAQELQHVGGEAGRAVLHALIGIVIGVITSFEMRRPTAPLTTAVFGRVSSLGRAFEKVVFAQVRISAINAVLTGVFLVIILPLFGVDLPLRKTLVLMTFIVGLIPVLGNLMSNTAIVIIAFGTSPPAALACLGFLVVIHKLEYFLNARIVGGQIHAAAWEILIAMVLFEATFGIAGLIAAPIFYAYAKGELEDRGLI